jgi:hypothetical protein
MRFLKPWDDKHADDASREAMSAAMRTFTGFHRHVGARAGTSDTCVRRHRRTVLCVMDHVGQHAQYRHVPPREPPTRPLEKKGKVGDRVTGPWVSHLPAWVSLRPHDDPAPASAALPRSTPDGR